MVVTEGGHGESAVEAELQAVRLVATGVLLDVLTRTDSVHDVVLCTDIEPFPVAVPAGVTRLLTGQTFHLGAVLTELVADNRWDVLVVAGGGSCPLLARSDFESMIELAVDRAPAVVANNPLSGDVLAVAPASAVLGLDLPPTDNFLGFLLEEAGMTRLVYSAGGRSRFDIDTPTDLLFLEKFGCPDERIRQAIGQLPWDRSRLDHWLERVARPWTEVSLVGRVSPGVVQYVNDRLNWRTRVYSEERGMKALGREHGQARSLIGEFGEACGWKRLFSTLSDASDACIFDTRVVMSHRRALPAAADRFYSDLYMSEQVNDAWLRAFTREAAAASIPIILGGHSIVAGGLMLLVNYLCANGNEELVRHIDRNRKENFS